MTGVILINFGGPRTTDEISLFLTDIFKDVLPRPLKPFAKVFARLRLPRAKKMYAAIGGTSPVVDWTMKQAKALEIRLNEHVGEGLCPLPLLRAATEGRPYKTYIGMKYGKPSIDEAIANAKGDGCEKVMMLPLFFYGSKYTSMSLRGSEATEAISFKQLNSGDCFALRARNDKLYIDIIRSSLADWKDIPPPQITILFTAHSIPKSSAKNEPYVRQINDSISKIMEHFTGYSFQLAYQSAPFKLGWLGPDVRAAIQQIKTHELLIVPLGFACENLETIYEIDQLYVPYAKKLGLDVKRAPAFNDNPIFIDLLAEMVLGIPHNVP